MFDKRTKQKYCDKFLNRLVQKQFPGPVLFVCYINDLSGEIHACVKWFADDTKVYADVSKSINSQELQDDTSGIAGVHGALSEVGGLGPFASKFFSWELLRSPISVGALGGSP